MNVNDLSSELTPPFADGNGTSDVNVPAEMAPKPQAVVEPPCVFDDDIEIDDWDRDFVFPKAKVRWTQEVTLVYRGKQAPGQMVFPDEVIMDDDCEQIE